MGRHGGGADYVHAGVDPPRAVSHSAVKDAMLTLTIQDQPNGIALPDLTARLTRAVFSTNLHGDEAVQVSAPMSLSAAFQRFDRAGALHALITDGAATPFQGR